MADAEDLKSSGPKGRAGSSPALGIHYQRFMGGYGATRIGMKHAGVFGRPYIMSPCCLSPRPAGPGNSEMDKALEAVKTPQDSATLPFGGSRPDRHRCSVVTRSKESSVVSRFA